MEEDRIKRVLEERGYLLRETLGRGAFSRVYRVERRGTGELLACKVSAREELLRRESEVLKRLRHPLFAEMREYFREEDAGFLVMERIEGESLGEAVRRGAYFSAGRTAEVGMELAEGLLYLHEGREPLFFRDVKPDNIMIRKDGRVKLLDLGCACAPGQERRSRAGTPGFAAPEQLAEGGVLTPACDVYGLGRTLLRMLGGEEGERSGAREGGGRRGEGADLYRRGKASLRERGQRKRLRRFLDACAREEPSRRPADMRAVMKALALLCRPAGRRNREELWQEGVVCEKNIRKCACKNY